MADVTHVITSLGIGGAEQSLLRLVTNATGSTWRHHVVSLTAGGAIGDALRVAGSPVEDVGLPLGRIPGLGGTVRLGRALRRSSAGIVHGWMYHGNLAATAGTLLSGRCRPVIWAVRHSLHDLKKEKRMTQAIIRSGPFLSRFAAVIVYVSRVSAAQHESLGYPASKTAVIPNGFDCAVFRPDPRAKARLASELGIPIGRIVIGIVGRAHPMKDHLNGIRAVGMLLRAGHDAHLVMIGRGADAGNEAVVRATQDAGISERVSLLGERHDVVTLMPGFDLLALSSAWGEGFPNVLGEAMACAVPCVATDVGDSGWIVGDTGIVVPPRDSEALATGLARLIEIGAEGRADLGATARARIVEHFSLAEIVRRYDALYDSLLGPHPPAGRR